MIAKLQYLDLLASHRLSETEEIQVPTPSFSRIGKFRDGNIDYFNLLGQAADGVYAFWETGQKSLLAHPAYSRDGSQAAEVKRLQSTGMASITWSAETLRVARRFANRCDKPTLVRMLRESRQHGIEPGYVIFTTLFEVTDRRLRKQLWKDHLAAGGWSKSQLESAIRQRRSPQVTRNGTGRTVRPPRNSNDAKDRLVQAAGTFERICFAVETSLHWFDNRQQRCIKSAQRAMTALKKAMHRKD